MTQLVLKVGPHGFLDGRVHGKSAEYLTRSGGSVIDGGLLA